MFLPIFDKYILFEVPKYILLLGWQNIKHTNLLKQNKENIGVVKATTCSY